MKPENTPANLSNKSPKELAEIGIFNPIEKRYDDTKNTYWVVPNQKILVVNPELPGLRDFIKNQDQDKTDYDQRQEKSGVQSKEVIPRPPALENSANNFFRSLINLLTGWLRWLFGDKKPDADGPKIDDKGIISWSFEGTSRKKVDFRVVRASRCPNEDAEYGKPSLNVLVEWNQVLSGNALTPFGGLYDQIDNHFLINPDEHSDPGWPEQAEGDIMKMHPSDFLAFDSDDHDFYTTLEKKHENYPIVAVMDTGLGYKWKNKQNGIERHYISNTKGEEKRHFILAKSADSCAPGADFGYCGVADYLKNPVPGPQLAALSSLSASAILPSPFDDNLVDQEGPGGVIKEEVGRHGTLIAAILNRDNCRVLPTKAFNGGGMGILFDVLDCCNYLMASKRAGTPIKILNASFNGSLNPPAEKLFRKKIETLTEKYDIWVVAAAGNANMNLDGTSIFPAQFGLPVSEGGIKKVITVNSKYANSSGPVGNTGRAVAITAVSPIDDGFPSAIRNNAPSDSLPIPGTSFAAPFVACALARLSLAGLSRAAAVSDIASGPAVSGVTFTATPSTP